MADAQAKIRITAQDDTGAAFKKASANLQQLQASAAGLAGTLGGALAVGGLTALISGAIDAADKLHDLSQQTGISVQALGGLGFAAEQNGGNLESVAAAAGKLNKSLAEAAAGVKDAAEPFNLLGISVKDASGATKNADVVFAELADKFQNFNDGPEKAALALKIFGKAGAEQIALLNEGGDALRANIEYYKRYSGVTDEVAKASDAFNDTLGKINLISRSLGTTIASALLPSLQAVADELLRVKENGAGFAPIAGSIKFVFDSIALGAASASFALTVAGLKLGAFAAQIAVVLRNGSIGEFTAISDAVRADISRATTDFKIFQQKILGIGLPNANDQSAAESRRLGLTPSAIKTNAPRLGGGGGGADKAKREIDLSNKALASYTESLEKQLQKNLDLSATEEALIFLRKKGAGATLDEAAAVLNLAKQLDREAEQAERVKQGREFAIETGDRVQKENEDRAARLKALNDATPTAKLEAARADVALLTEEFQRFIDTLGQAGISENQYLEAVSTRLNLNAEALDKNKTLAEELGLSFTSAFEDAIVGGKNLSDILKGLEQDILRIITRKLVTEPLGNAITGILGGSGGGIFGSGGGGIMQSIFGSLFGGFKADGGPVMAGVPYMVGERGRELFVPQRSGTIVPNGGVGNTVNISVNQSFAAGTSRATTLQAAADARRQLEMAGRNL